MFTAITPARFFRDLRHRFPPATPNTTVSLYTQEPRSDTLSITRPDLSEGKAR
jgi:hypothetical protein